MRKTQTPAAAHDEALLDAIAEGDRAALRALYERHAPWLTLRLARDQAAARTA